MKLIISETQLKKLITERDLSDSEGLTTFSKIIWTIVKEYKKADEYYKKAVYWTLSHTLYQWTNNHHPSYISKNVADAFIYLQPDRDPFSLFFRAKDTFGRKKGKKSFLLFEHTTPIGYFCDRILESSSIDEVYTKLKYYTGVCIVTRPENDCLDENFKSERPGRWRNSYRICKIDPMDKKEFLQYKAQKMGKFSEEEKKIITQLYKDFFSEYY